MCFITSSHVLSHVITLSRVITCVITCHHMCYHVITCYHMSSRVLSHVITCVITSSHVLSHVLTYVLQQYSEKAELRLRIILFGDVAPVCRGSVSRRFERTRCLRLEDVTVPKSILLADRNPRQNLCETLKSSNLESK